MDRPVTIFISAAETSGDERATQLMHALRKRIPHVHFVGAAGPKMAAAGCEVVADLTQHASMLARAVFRIGYFVREVTKLQRAIRQIRPDVHIPVDSPAMNWHLAKAAKKCGIPVVYYIAPQVWAWGPWRIRKLARLTDHVACILPFEESYLRSRGVRATYVGHPLFDTLPDRPDPLPDLLDAWYNGTWRVALLAGSRRGEIRDHTRALMEVADAIQHRWANAKCTFIAHTDAHADNIRAAAGRKKAPGLDIVAGQTMEILGNSHFAVAKSGTITLELGHFGVPMVVFYRVNRPVRIAWGAMGKWAVPTPAFSLVNILAGRRIVPELIPWKGGASSLKKMVLEVMQDIGYLVETRRNLLETMRPLRASSGQTASDNAADLIQRILETTSGRH